MILLWGEGRMWGSTWGYIGSVSSIFEEVKSLSTRWGWGFFFFCRFIGDLDWDSRYSPFYSFFLSIDREVFGNLFYFGNYLGISCVEMEFERLYHWFFFFFFCFFVYIGLGWYFIGSLLRELEFLLIFFFILARWLFVNYLSKILLK